MAEYIEREAIEYPYMTMTLWGLNNATCKAYNEGVKAAADAIAAMPAADVVEVVRCKDCKHLGKVVRLFAGDAPVDVASCTMFKMSPRTLNEFCSCGERRGDDGD